MWYIGADRSGGWILRFEDPWGREHETRYNSLEDNFDRARLEIHTDVFDDTGLTIEQMHDKWWAEQDDNAA